MVGLLQKKEVVAGIGTQQVLKQQSCHQSLNKNKCMEQKGLRYNSGKTRYDLIEPFALEQLANVFTKGSEKYADHNWLKGLKWSGIASSLKRHLAAYENGEDFDKETGLLHVAHVAWNAMALVSHYRYHPDLDDRINIYKYPKKIGLDIDGVLADFNGSINELLGTPEYSPVDWNDPLVNKKFSEVKYDKAFWLNLKPLVQPEDIPFEPHCYITSRSIDKDTTKEWLSKNGFPDAPVFSVGSGESKVEVAKSSGVDYFIDDYYKNFVELNSNGVCTFLMSCSWNSKYNVGYKRIKNFQDFKERFL